MTRFRLGLTLLAAATLGAVLAASLAPHRARADEGSILVVGAGPRPARVFTMVAVDAAGIKRWEPGTLICYVGEKITIKLKNRVPPADSLHGFEIAAFKVHVVVSAKEDTEVSFTPDRPGLFDINCFLHPAHIGGQLLVLAK